MALTININHIKFTGDSRADLYPDEGVSLKRQILTNTGLNNFSRQFTSDFIIPASPRNNRLLEHWETKSNESTVNPNKAIPAYIEIDDVYHIQGNIELLSVTWVKGKPENYSIVFYGNESNLKIEVGNDLLPDVDWSPLMMIDIDTGSPHPFTWTFQNIVDSWDNVKDFHCFIPVISWKRWMIWSSSTSTDFLNNIGDEPHGVLMSELRVGLKLGEMIKQIGIHSGITFLFHPNLEEMLSQLFVIPSRFEDQALTLSEEFYETRVQTDGVIPSENVPAVMVFTIELSDPRNRWDGISKYTAEFGGGYLFKVSFVIASGLGRTHFTCRLIDETGGDVEIDNYSVDTNSGGNFFLTGILTKDSVYYFTIESSKSATIYSEMYTEQIPVGVIDQQYDPSPNMPMMKNADFLLKFIEAFNLLVVSTGLKEYTFIDISSLFDSFSDIINLEDYVDEKKLVYKKIDVFDRINFKHMDGEDSANMFFFDVKGRQFGELDYYADIDYSDGDLTQESIFNVFPPAYMNEYDSAGNVKGNTDLWHHYQLSNDNPPKPVLAEFLMMYRNGISPTLYTYYLQNGIGPAGNPEFLPLTDAGRYSQVQDESSTKNSNTVSYSIENPFIGVPAENTIMNRFWLSWLVQVYKRTSYTLTLSFPANFGVYIKITDVSLVFLNGFYHIVAESTYDSAKNMLTLKLFRFDAGVYKKAITTETKGTLKIETL